MEINEVIELNVRNIKQAIADYGRHTCQTEDLDNISDEFIERLASDSAYAKQGLRELFSKSPAWDPNLQALVLNGTSTHDPDYEGVYWLARQILKPAEREADELQTVLIDNAIRFFSTPNDDYYQELGIASIEKLAPKAYAPGKKLSRVFKSLCNALGVADDTAGSEFQKLYTQFADELTTKKIGFKLFVSINPAHFLTMSNPKRDGRGSTLTSCHTLNATDYSYNNGCSGYARDKTSFIVFTVDDPNNPELLNNRKTSRQVFAYEPGNGVMLQSRFYNTRGGTRGAQEESPLYRDLIQREISALENAVNLWTTTKFCKLDDGDKYVQSHEGFGGYEDWKYEDFDAMISVRKDHARTHKPLTIGNFGLCIVCGEETSEGLYCPECSSDSKCYECGCHSRDLHSAYDYYGNCVEVCEDCLAEYYRWCECCESYHSIRSITYIESEDIEVCNDCLERWYSRCDECGEYHRTSDLNEAIGRYGEIVSVCNSCVEDYYFYCEDCGDLFHYDLAREATSKYGEILVCPHCFRENHEQEEESGSGGSEIELEMAS